MGDLEEAIAELKAWMVARGARAIIDNLAPGATAAHLDAIEAELGFPLGADLRALWSLHDGQRTEGNGFVGSQDLLASRQALADHVRRRTMRPVHSLRQHPTPKSGLRDEERASDAWVAFTMRDSDGLLVNTESGRVFGTIHDDDPPLGLVATSIPAWARAYANDVRDGRYGVQSGFGGIYLAYGERDEADDDEDDEDEPRLSLPASELVAQAVARKNPHEVMDFLKLAKARAPAAYEEAIERLFANDVPPAFVARALQPMLQALVLPPERWRIIAQGAEANGNAAARDVALRKAGRSG